MGPLVCNKRVDQSGFCAVCNRSCQVVGITAEEAKGKEVGDGGREALEEILRQRYFSEPLQLTIRAKMEMYQGEKRANIGCVDARPISYGQHGRTLLKDIDEMLAKDSSSL